MQRVSPLFNPQASDVLKLRNCIPLCLEIASEDRLKTAVNLNINTATVISDLLILQEYNGLFPGETCRFLYIFTTEYRLRFRPAPACFSGPGVERLYMPPWFRQLDC